MSPFHALPPICLPARLSVLIPCTDGGDQLHGGRHFGFHCHDVEVHEIEESQMEHTVVCRSGKRAQLSITPEARRGVHIFNPSS